jgi:zinc protease
MTEPVRLARLELGWLSPPALTNEDAACEVLAVLLARGESSRLYRRLVRDQEIAQDVSASQESLALASIFRITVTGRPGVAPKQLEATTQEVIDELRRTPPTERELVRARNRIVTSRMIRLQRIGGFGGRADTLNRYNQYVGDPGFLARDLARYDALTPESVHAVAAGLLTTETRAVVTTVPRR